MFIRYPHPLIFVATGKHAAQYLQNRLTNDIRALQPGKGSCEAAALTPQGRIQAVVTVSAVAADSFLLTADGGSPEETLKALTQFKVAERVEFVDCSAQFALLHIDGGAEAALWEIFSPEVQLPIAGTFESFGEARFISRPRFSGSGIHAVIPIEQLACALEKLRAGSRELSGDELTLARVAKRIPTFPEELNQELLLSESGRTDLVSFTKGCYVGQEVVAKIDAVGRAPRALVTFTTEPGGVPAQGDTIIAVGDETSRPLGKILTVAKDPGTGGSAGFAVIRYDMRMKSGEIQASGFRLSTSIISSE